MLEGEQVGVAVCDWETPPPSFGADTLDRCSYSAYELTKNSKDKTTHGEDSVAYAYSDYEVATGPLGEITNILGQESGIDGLGLSNFPMHYRKYKGYNGFMGWHTNHDYPGDRWYFVYNTDNHSSFFRYIEPDTGQMITKWEPEGWCLNHFVVGDHVNPLWHCVYTDSHRISFGIRSHASPLFKQYKWKNIVLR